MVKLVEFSHVEEFKPTFDVVDDLHVYMRNDPMFYRKEYFPMVLKMNDAIQSGSKVNTKEMIVPMINKGVHSYCKQFNLARTSSDIFTDKDISAVAEKIYSEELTAIRNGAYK
tara:strand:- start:353 stop:691 length:339 start_codon:yes stop_codon:yes gene_type:complete